MSYDSSIPSESNERWPQRNGETTLRKGKPSFDIPDYRNHGAAASCGSIVVLRKHLLVGAVLMLAAVALCFKPASELEVSADGGCEAALSSWAYRRLENSTRATRMPKHDP